MIIERICFVNFELEKNRHNVNVVWYDNSVLYLWLQYHRVWHLFFFVETIFFKKSILYLFCHFESIMWKVACEHYFNHSEKNRMIIMDNRIFTEHKNDLDCILKNITWKNTVDEQKKNWNVKFFKKSGFILTIILEKICL